MVEVAARTLQYGSKKHFQHHKTKLMVQAALADNLCERRDDAQSSSPPSSRVKSLQYCDRENDVRAAHIQNDKKNVRVVRPATPCCTIAPARQHGDSHTSRMLSIALPEVFSLCCTAERHSHSGSRVRLFRKRSRFSWLSVLVHLQHCTAISVVHRNRGNTVIYSSFAVCGKSTVRGDEWYATCITCVVN